MFLIFLIFYGVLGFCSSCPLLLSQWRGKCIFGADGEKKVFIWTEINFYLNLTEFNRKFDSIYL